MSNLRLFRRQDGFAFIERRSLRDDQQRAEEIRGLFQSHGAPDDEHVLLGVAGFQARAALKNLFNELPDAEKRLVSLKVRPPSCGLNTLQAFPAGDRRAATAERVTEALRGEAQFNNSQQWLALNIEAGLPVIDAANSAQFIPGRPTCRRWAASALKRLLHRPGDGRAGKIPRRANKRALWTWRVTPAVYRKRVKI